MEGNQQDGPGDQEEGLWTTGVQVYEGGSRHGGRKRRRWGRSPHKAVFHHLQNDHEAEDPADQKALKMSEAPFILQFSGQPGQRSGHKAGNKVSAVAFGLPFSLMFKQRKI